MGLYLSLERPYSKVDASVSFPLAIRPGFLPYQRQRCHAPHHPHFQDCHHEDDMTSAYHAFAAPGS